MSLTNVMNIAATGMSAQSIRLNVTASNMANVDVVSGTADGVYKARHPIFESIHQNGHQGVQVKEVVEEKVPGRLEYRPNHPLANNEGYVYLPNVNIVDEMANMISASRSYQFNVEVANAAKQMLQRTLQLGQ